MISRILFRGYQSILSTWNFQKLDTTFHLEISTGRLLVSPRHAVASCEDSLPTRLCSIALTLQPALPVWVPCFLWFGLSSPVLHRSHPLICSELKIFYQKNPPNILLEGFLIITKIKLLSKKES